ncbi:MAG: aminopeptidase P family protein [Elusimicrobia bacterium]|nr:aminopeptidase P family protein [Elusimicrobiota bacterium]
MNRSLAPQALPSLQKQLVSLGVDAFLVTDPVNIRYLTGIPADASWLFVTAKRVFYLTDFRYAEDVGRVLKTARVVQTRVSLFDTLFDLAVDSWVRTIGIEPRHMTVATLMRLRSLAGRDVRFVPKQGVVEELRVVKTPQEIALIRKCININLKGFKRIGKIVRPGITERRVLEELERFVRDEDASLSFPPIIASGPNSAFPHAQVTDRKFRSGDPVLVDFGVEIQGYKSDLTRMFFLGKMARSFQENLSFIRQAQKEAYKVIKPGVRAKDADGAARGFLDKNGLAERFGHSLGHGVGLNIHEDPSISCRSGAVLSKGMVITVEPGVYFTGKYGVRLEEMVLVTATGCEVLSDHDQ